MCFSNDPLGSLGSDEDASKSFADPASKSFELEYLKVSMELTALRKDLIQTNN